MAELLNEARAPAASIVHGTGKELSGFKKFMLRGDVVDLAVGIVIGAAFGNVVQAVVKDLITPLISLFGGAPDFANYVLTVGKARFALGDLLNVVIAFVLLAAVVYFLVVQPVNALMDRYRPEPQPAPVKDCPECTSKIPQAARRCPQCAAQLEPPSEATAAAMRLAAAPAGADIANEAAQMLAAWLQGGERSRAG
jgi:large conductance mechanosensitive channel